MCQVYRVSGITLSRVVIKTQRLEKRLGENEKNIKICKKRGWRKYLPSSSGLRGSDPPPQPWQGCALPNELNPHIYKRLAESLRQNERPEGDSNPWPLAWQASVLTNWTTRPMNHSVLKQFDGNNRARTYDPLLVRQMLSQLSYASNLFDFDA